jgi:formate hydrogenlyase subunit 6/NADH:ubiquinone oxidoreductase subunit I
MKIGSMFLDVASGLFKKPVTQQYPFVRQPAPQRLRGKLQWASEKCTGCGLCVKDCPADAIEMVVNDKPNKVFVLRYHVDRCIFCAQCTVNCRFKCLEMSNTEWELAALSKEPFLIYYGKEEAVKAYLDKLAQATEGENQATDVG